MDRRPGAGVVLIAAAVLILGAVHIYALRFTYDDAFISYRYAENLVHGHGLVYNPGEHVEGYSNFLWTILMAAVIRLGGDPEPWSNVLSALCVLAALALVLRAAHRRGLDVAVTGLLVASSTSWAAWGTGGLETGAFMLCLTAGALLLGEALAPHGAGGADELPPPPPVDRAPPAAPAPKARPFLGSAIAFGLASLVRADGMLVAALAGASLLVLLLRRRSPWFLFLLWAAIVALFVVPHLIWRLTYYGTLVPRTATVKAPGAARLADGLHYLWVAFLELRLYLLLAPIAVALLARRRLAIPSEELFVIGGVLVPFTIYLAATGGDFMPVFRFVAPMVPLLGYTAAAAFGELAAGPAPRETSSLAAKWFFVLTFVGLNIGSSVHQQQIWSEGELVSVGWARQETQDWLRIGDLLHRIAQPTDTLATSAGGAAPYRSKLPTIEMNGLTAPDLSQFHRRASSRPGHLITLDERSMAEHPPQILLGHPLVHPTPASLVLGLELRPEWRDRVLANYQAVGLALPGKPPRFVGCALRNDVAERIMAAGQRAASEPAR